MTDVVDKETRSRIMASVRSANTRPEMAIRHAMHARGFRYRLHARGVSGKPDLLLRRYRAAIFVHGCFWHRHEGCRLASTPGTRVDYWQAKFAANRARDARVRDELLSGGWRVAVVWECALKRGRDVDSVVDQLVAWLPGEAVEIEIG